MALPKNISEYTKIDILTLIEIKENEVSKLGNTSIPFIVNKVSTLKEDVLQLNLILKTL